MAHLKKWLHIKQWDYDSFQCDLVSNQLYLIKLLWNKEKKKFKVSNTDKSTSSPHET